MVEYYCMLSQRIIGTCVLLLVVSGIGLPILAMWASDFSEHYDNCKSAMIILACVMSLSILGLIFVPGPDVIRAMMSE